MRNYDPVTMKDEHTSARDAYNLLTLGITHYRD